MSTSTTENYEELLATAGLSDGERCRLLSAERRRIVCDVLADEGTPIGFEELAATVSARENDTSEPDPESDVEISLHHVHLPKLADAGVIDYDTDARRIEVNRAGFGQLSG